MSEQRNLNVTLLGGEGCGKSAVFLRFIANIFVPDVKKTIEDETTGYLEVDDQRYRIELCDMNSKEHNPLRDTEIRMTHAFIFLYDITNHKSFEEVPELINEVITIKAQKPIMILVGCKLDLETLRQVTTEEGATLANLHGCPHLECSAKTPTNIHKIFELAVRQTLQQQMAQHKKETCILS